MQEIAFLYSKGEHLGSLDGYENNDNVVAYFHSKLAKLKQEMNPKLSLELIQDIREIELNCNCQCVISKMNHNSN